MATTNNLPGPIVKEVLKKGNYKQWSFCIRNYLLAQDLWDVVQTDYPKEEEAAAGEEEEAAAGEEEKHRVWRRKDAAALHAIVMSSGEEAVDLVLDLTSAKAAWDKLAHNYGDSDEETDEETDWYDPQYQTLYKAIQIGDWEETKRIIGNHPEALTAVISYEGKRALHVAAAFKHLHIVEGLVELISREDLELRDAYGDTALIHACFAGITKMAECMVNKNKEIIIIPRPTQNLLPVTLAIVLGHTEMARYLYSVTPLRVLLPEEGYYGASLLRQCLIPNNIGLDMALDLLRCCPQLAITPDDDDNTFVEGLATRPSIFQGGCRLRFFQKWIYDWFNIEPRVTVNEFCIDVQNSNAGASDGKISLICGLMDRAVSTFFDLLGINQIYETKLLHKQSQELLRITCDQISALNIKKLIEIRSFNLIFRAAAFGNPEFIIEVIKANPDLLALSGAEVNAHFFFSAVHYRRAQVFNLIHGFIWMDKATNFIDEDDFTMLHKAGMLAPQKELNRIPGAALQMQRELQWFKEVESIMSPYMKEAKNKDGMTARELFTREHKDLVKEGEKWMKKTATSCTVVGALIVTIMFAAAFTVPGGSNQDTGNPMLFEQKSFMFFIISDAISLFSSTTSVLMFLGILTSHYREHDFLKSLPTNLIIGLSMLFISIATMMATFCAALFIMLKGKLWIAAPVILLASVPVGLFVKLQFPLLIEISVSTFGPGIFNRNVKRWL